MSLNNALNAAMEQANTAADSLPTVSNDNKQSSVVTLPAGRAISVDDALSQVGNAVDAYLKVKDTGLRIGEDIMPFEKLGVSIKLAEVAAKYTVSFSLAGNQTYKHSVDGIREMTTGQAWADVIQMARSTDARCKGQYISFDLVFTLTKDVQGKAGVIPAGTRIGYSTPYTGTQMVAPWVKAMKAAGRDEDEDIAVTLVHIPKKKGSNNYGVFSIENVTN
ncbi:MULTISPECIES: hypothetical protein [unclassified Beijerinckia]|uniref:hypothetical protein n=1 Tax=unclassified Beijerinckia TaxID=2638183 RepID=UPI0008967CFE|nr:MULTISPECIES: hypothetical protein [unclassified Beijerinckia]MDH7796471.1 hypothetical protein [Beijerinckia sp. GAS462]SEC46570.1 hypothetical protein SAMN05443249_2755 [Beijerinckia sp. 28-YEA-48]